MKKGRERSRPLLFVLHILRRRKALIDLIEPHHVIQAPVIARLLRPVSGSAYPADTRPGRQYMYLTRNIHPFTPYKPPDGLSARF